MLRTELRTHHCGALRLSDKKKEVTLCGWVQDTRDKGHLLWIDLRDGYGLTQVILEQGQVSPEIFAIARKLGREDVLQVQGQVIERSAKNKEIETGDIEIVPTSLTLLNHAATPPFLIAEPTNGKEELRMCYRYLDLRRPPLQHNLRFRHKLAKATRNFLDNHAFVELETPLLIKSTPEGARDFLVPSRMQADHYYALPQSPQLFKQLLMIGGFDRYYQLAKCFRDEDLRADRQPEFTQIDCEMSFVGMEDIISLFERFMRSIFEELIGVSLPAFPHMDYQEAMSKYGTDTPDLRWDLPFSELTTEVQGYGFPLFDSAKAVVAIRLPGGASCSRKVLDQLRDLLKREHPATAGLVYVKSLEEGGYKSSVDKFYDTSQLAKWCSSADAKRGDLLLVLGGETLTAVRAALSDLRKELITVLKIAPSKQYAPVWIRDFPLLAWNKELGKYDAEHHPFTAPHPADQELLKTKPGSVRAQAYDLVINGAEIGGGSIRMHDASLQREVLKVLGMNDKVIEDRFGFLLRALSFGAPPHGGIAFGLDRLALLMVGGSSIRDFIPFPKNNQGRDTMLGAPSLLH